MSHKLNFEILAKAFMELVQERYPSTDRILRLASGLVSKLETDSKLKEVLAKIIILSSFRDAVRKVDPMKIFETIQHRDEIYEAILNALEDLEADLEELEEEFESNDFLDVEKEEKEEETVLEEKKEEKDNFWDVSGDVDLGEDWWK